MTVARAPVGKADPTGSGAVLAALVLDLFIEPSEDAAEWIVLALPFVFGLPVAIYDLRALRRQSF